MGIDNFEKSFAYFASRVSKWTGSSIAFCLAALFIIAWAVSGRSSAFPLAGKSVIDTGTTIGTFLMVFVIQNTQNRDGLALQIKLDEILRAAGKAENSDIDLEDRSQGELDQLKADFATLAVRARNGSGRRKTITVDVVEKSVKSGGTNTGPRIESVPEEIVFFP